MNLSEDGVLVMQLEQRRLLIRVRISTIWKKFISFSFQLNKYEFSQAMFSVF
ncbi:inner membrane protein [Escherichia coli]|nr:inner membrane protein [Escherichia coli]